MINLFGMQSAYIKIKKRNLSVDKRIRLYEDYIY